MSSSKRSESAYLDLDVDVPTSNEDVEALRRARQETPSWLALTPAEIDALLPRNARRPPTPRGAKPFELP